MAKQHLERDIEEKFSFILILVAAEEDDQGFNLRLWFHHDR